MLKWWVGIFISYLDCESVHDCFWCIMQDLLELLVKLREEHYYCLFCGCQVSLYSSFCHSISYNVVSITWLTSEYFLLVLVWIRRSSRLQLPWTKRRWPLKWFLDYRIKLKADFGMIMVHVFSIYLGNKYGCEVKCPILFFAFDLITPFNSRGRFFHADSSELSIH